MSPLPGGRVRIAAIAAAVLLLLAAGLAAHRAHPPAAALRPLAAVASVPVTLAAVPASPVPAVGGRREPSDDAIVGAHEVQLLRAVAPGSPPPPPRPHVTVLEFHVVLPESEIVADGLTQNDDIISLEQFSALLQWLKATDSPIVGLSAVRAVLDGQPVPARAVVLTFDDGYAACYTYVYPLLKRYGDPAVMFPVGAWVTGGPGSLPGPSRLPFLGWSQVHEMAASGLVDIQSHTWSMHAMTRAGASLVLASPAERQADLAKDRAAVTAATGRPVDAFAYPYGASSPAVLADLRSGGFRLAFWGLGEPVYQGDPPLLLPRVFIHPGAYPGFLNRYLAG